MTIWLDEQFSPFLAKWISREFNVICKSIYELRLSSTDDLPLFRGAAKDNAIMMTKDRDMIHILARMGPPPKMIWVRCGNRSNKAMQQLLRPTLGAALKLLESGDAFVEIS